MKMKPGGSIRAFMTPVVNAVADPRIAIGGAKIKVTALSLPATGSSQYFFYFNYSFKTLPVS